MRISDFEIYCVTLSLQQIPFPRRVDPTGFVVCRTGKYHWPNWIKEEEKVTKKKAHWYVKNSLHSIHIGSLLALLPHKRSPTEDHEVWRTSRESVAHSVVEMMASELLHKMNWKNFYCKLFFHHSVDYKNIYIYGCNWKMMMENCHWGFGWAFIYFLLPLYRSTGN